MPGPLAFGVLLTEYDDVFRLAARPRGLVRLALRGDRCDRPAARLLGRPAATTIGDVNLRTFLPPPETAPVAAPPAVGAPAPALPDGAPDRRPFVVAFLRHTGCPFAEWTAQQLRAAAERHPDIAWIAVSHGSDEATEAWIRAVGGLGSATVVTDRARGSYAAWGLGRTSLMHFAGRRSLSQVARLARQGVRNRHPDGTRWQRAGTFAVDADGIVRWRQLPDHAGSLPDFEQAAAALGA